MRDRTYVHDSVTTPCVSEFDNAKDGGVDVAESRRQALSLTSYPQWETSPSGTPFIDSACR